RVLSGDDLLFELVVSGGATRSRHCSVHDSGPRERLHRRPFVGRTANSERSIRACRVAMALLGRGTSRGVAWLDRAVLSIRSPRGGAVAQSRRAALAS